MSDKPAYPACKAKPIPCAYCWHPITFESERDKKKTIIAAKVNGEGPYCELCRCLIMAQRIAINRGWDNVEGYASLALRRCKRRWIE